MMVGGQGVVVLNWCQVESTIRTVNTVIYESTNCAKWVVVVDNNSGVAEKEFLRRWWMDNWATGSGGWRQKRVAGNWVYCALILRNINDGYGPGNNRGIELLRKEGRVGAITIINNDVLLTGEYFLRVAASAEKTGAGIIAPLVLDGRMQGRVWSAGGLRVYGSAFHRRRRGLEYYQKEGPKRVNYAPGCALTISEDVFVKYGLFREDLFLYTEDLEYSRRVGGKQEILCEPSVVVIHNPSLSSSGEEYNDNFLYFGRRNVGKISRNAREKALYMLLDSALFVVPTVCRLVLKKGWKAVGFLKILFRGVLAGWKS